MKNVRVVIATTFALVTAAVIIEIEANAPAAPIVSAPAPIAAPEQAAAAPESPEALKLPPFSDDVATADQPAVPPTPAETASAAIKAPDEGPSMRDASPLPALVAPSPAADAKPDVEPNDGKAAPAQHALFAIPQGPVPDGEAEKNRRSGDESEDPEAASKAAIVKPVIAKPAMRRPATEKAVIDKPTDAPKPAQPVERHYRFAKAHSIDRGPEGAPRERHLAHTVRWQGGDIDRLRSGAGAYGFSASFGGCQYRGVVSTAGYRIEKSC